MLSLPPKNKYSKTFFFFHPFPGLVLPARCLSPLHLFFFLQVEFANVILLNKADLATPADMATLEALVRRLNPAARIVRTVSSEIGLKEVVGTGEFDLDEASQAAGWLQVSTLNVFARADGRVKALCFLL